MSKSKVTVTKNDSLLTIMKKEQLTAFPKESAKVYVTSVFPREKLDPGM